MLLFQTIIYFLSYTWRLSWWTHNMVEFESGMYGERYWLIIFVFVNGRLKESNNTDLLSCLRLITNGNLLISQHSVCKRKNYLPISYTIHIRGGLNSLLCIWEKRNNSIKDPEPLKFCRRFERFAANLVDCLSVKDYRFWYLWMRVIEGKFANQRPFKTASKISGLDLLCYYFVFLIYTLTTTLQTRI